MTPFIILTHSVQNISFNKLHVQGFSLFASLRKYSTRKMQSRFSIWRVTKNLLKIRRRYSFCLFWKYDRISHATLIKEAPPLWESTVPQFYYCPLPSFFRRCTPHDYKWGREAHWPREWSPRWVPSRLLFTRFSLNLDSAV